MTKQHAKLYAPSSAHRYINCPGSVTVVVLYPREDSEHSLKGDMAHDLLEVGVMFGVRPSSEDPDMDENVERVLDHLDARRKEYGPGTVIYTEQQLAIPETGEFGTSDLVIDANEVLEIEDYKNGYVLVHVRDPKTGLLNEQLMSYLLGAIAKYGPRARYRITLHQPNYNHVDGTTRTEEVTHQDVQDFRTRLTWAVGSREFFAGSWCKKSYCPHRANCSTFLAWQQDNEQEGWFASDVHAISDDQLAQRLDYLDVLQGQRDESRKEAIRRIMQQDRQIVGYKMVKGRKDRAFAAEPPVIKALRDLGCVDEEIFDSYSFKDKKYTLRTVKGIEDLVKLKARPLGRGKWKAVWGEHFAPHVREFVNGLALERATDGRPAHRRGSEFGTLVPPDSPAAVTQTV